MNMNMNLDLQLLHEAIVMLHAARVDAGRGLIPGALHPEEASASTIDERLHPVCLGLEVRGGNDQRAPELLCRQGFVTLRDLEHRAEAGIARHRSLHVQLVRLRDDVRLLRELLHEEHQGPSALFVHRVATAKARVGPLAIICGLPGTLGGPLL